MEDYVKIQMTSQEREEIPIDLITLTQPNP